MQNTNKLFNIDREFIRWFYEEPYPSGGVNRCMVMAQVPKPTVEQRDYWMREAYKAGARAMWQDINATLMDYACATEGLQPEQLTPAEVFDRARENLWAYIYEQLDLFHEPN